MTYCTKCGTEWPEGVHFCGKCGVPLLSEPDVEQDEKVSKTPQINNEGKTEPSEMDTLIGAGKLAIKYSSIVAGLFIGMIFLIIFGIDATLEFLAVILALFLIYLIVKDSAVVKKKPMNSSEGVSDVPTSRSVPVGDDHTLFDDVASPLKTLGQYVLGGIGVLIVFFAALIMSSHDGTIVGYRFWLIICAAISIYVVFKMPETSERINRNQKIATIVGIIVVSYFIFNQIDEPDNSFLGKFSDAMSSGDYETVCSMQMDSNGRFILGSEKQSCVNELQDDCGSSGCDVDASLISSTDTGKQAEYTKNIFEYKVSVTNKAEDIHSWCEIWYVTENIDSGEQGFPRDYFTTTNGEELGSGEDVSC